MLKLQHNVTASKWSKCKVGRGQKDSMSMTSEMDEGGSTKVKEKVERLITAKKDTGSDLVLVKTTV